MKTLDEVIKALEICLDYNGCIGCPYFDEGCPTQRKRDGLYYLKKYQKLKNKYKIKVKMNDSISREALCNFCLNTKDKTIDANDIMRFPSIIKKQLKGRWKRREGSDCWECSKCHAVLEDEDLLRHNFYYCYHCGANMMNKSGYMDIEEVHCE